MINCVIVDDEPFARDLLENYCSHLPFLNIVATCSNAIEAKEVISKETIQLLFLDINMPVLSGIGFLKMLKDPPEVIFTTAYKEYAIDAFDLSACDYLLKPFSLERFIIAVDKVVEKLSIPKLNVSKELKVSEDCVFLKSAGQIYNIYYADLLYAEASGNSTKVVTKTHELYITMSFSQFENMLPATMFKRIHRSFIINQSRIDRIYGNRVFVSTFELPIGVNYREAFFKDLGVK